MNGAVESGQRASRELLAGAYGPSIQFRWRIRAEVLVAVRRGVAVVFT